MSPKDKAVVILTASYQHGKRVADNAREILASKSDLKQYDPMWPVRREALEACITDEHERLAALEWVKAQPADDCFCCICTSNQWGRNNECV